MIQLGYHFIHCECIRHTCSIPVYLHATVVFFVAESDFYSHRCPLVSQFPQFQQPVSQLLLVQRFATLFLSISKLKMTEKLKWQLLKRAHRKKTGGEEKGRYILDIQFLGCLWVLVLDGRSLCLFWQSSRLLRRLPWALSILAILIELCSWLRRKDVDRNHNRNQKSDRVTFNNHSKQCLTTIYKLFFSLMKSSDSGLLDIAMSSIHFSMRSLISTMLARQTKLCFGMTSNWTYSLTAIIHQFDFIWHDCGHWYLPFCTWPHLLL